MIAWIKRIASILAIATFFVLLLLGLVSSQSFSWEAFAPAFVRAFAGAALFWIVGIIIGDIVLKGVITDIEIDQKNLIEGGLLQQVHAIKERTLPGGSELPLVAVTTSRKKANEKNS
jgi:hypothetical protein